jgi:GAF domain-containing protein/ActR/RegA family two-component response regulator/anti-sigma regulatory factor (Ser/Thr protein kinase)
VTEGQDQRTRELEALTESSRLLTSTLDPGEVLDRLTGIARRQLAVEIARFWLLDDDGEMLRLRAHQGDIRGTAASKDELSTRESLVGRVMMARAPLILPDVQQDPGLKNRSWFEAEGLVSFLSVPILLDDQPVGILACMSRARREFTPADVAVAQALTIPAAAAVKNASLYQEIRERLEEIQAFQRITSETLSSPMLETALRGLGREMRALLGSDAAVCSLVNRQVDHLQAVNAVGTRTSGIPAYSPKNGQGLAALVLKEGRPIRSDDYLSDTRFTRTPALEAWAREEGIVAMMVAPVLDSGGEVLAFLWVFNRSATPFTDRHESTLASLAQQASLAIGRARALEQERESARQTAALLEIARACTSTLELKPLLKEIAYRAALAVGAERCAIYLRQTDHLQPVMSQFADRHADPALWSRFKALPSHLIEAVPAHAEAVRLRRPVEVKRGSSLIPDNLLESFDIQTSLIVPLVSNDRVVGTMSLDDSRPRKWKTAQIDLAMTIAAQVALAVDNARHYQEARQRAAEVEALAGIGETLSSTLDTQKVLEAIVDSASTLVGAQRAVVFELDQAEGCLRARATRGVQIDPGFTLHLGQGAAGDAALRLKPVWSADVLEQSLPGYDELHEPSRMPLGELICKLGFRAVLAVPVISRDTPFGAVAVCWDEIHRPDEREIRMLSALARHAALAMDNARLVTDLKRTLEDLRAAQGTLVRSATLRAVGELASGAAHHLNNLMAVVLGRAQLLLMKRPEPSTEASLRSIERAAVEAADTVRRIQGFSGGSERSSAGRFDLNAVVQEAIEFTRSRWQNEAKVQGALIEVFAKPGPIPEVMGQPTEIREAIINLILNAVDALPGGGTITLATQAEAGHVTLSVHDSGVGMSEEVARRAFEPFFTTKGVKRTGLGLAMAYGTVQRHGGQIALESEPGRGTMVRLTLPAAARETATGESAEPGKRVGSVLVIDDDSPVCDMIADVLASNGHQVTVATGGREGLARFENGRYDVVLTDLGMPDLNGWEVARAIKSSRASVPVLLLTGWADAVDASAGALVDQILKKPFDVEELAAAVTTAIGARGRQTDVGESACSQT